MPWSILWSAWRYLEQDPITDRAASAVLAVYEAALKALSQTVDCYLAGIKAWRRAHPDQSSGYAKQAVAVILTAKVNIRIPGCLPLAVGVRRQSAPDPR